MMAVSHGTATGHALLNDHHGSGKLSPSEINSRRRAMKNAPMILLSRQADVAADRGFLVRCVTLFASLSEVWEICSHAQRAARYYEELKPLTSQALAQRGLKRSDLSKAVFEKLIGRR
jgi:hypothetical protein